MNLFKFFRRKDNRKNDSRSVAESTAPQPSPVAIPPAVSRVEPEPVLSHEEPSPASIPGDSAPSEPKPAVVGEIATIARTDSEMSEVSSGIDDENKAGDFISGETLVRVDSHTQREPGVAEPRPVDADDTGHQPADTESTSAPLPVVEAPLQLADSSNTPEMPEAVAPLTDFLASEPLAIAAASEVPALDEAADKTDAPTASADTTYSVWRIMAFHFDEHKDTVVSWSKREGVVAVGWPTGDLRQKQFGSAKELLEIVTDTLPGNSASNRANAASSLWNFYHRVKRGDLVIISTGNQRAAVLRITGDYYYVDFEPPCYYEHRRSAELLPINPDVLWAQVGGAAPGQSIRSAFVELARGVTEAEVQQLCRGNQQANLQRGTGV